MCRSTLDVIKLRVSPVSSTTYPNDAGALPETESPERDLVHKMHDSGCQVCQSLRFPNPEPLWTSYAELQHAANDGCEPCDLLRQVSETVCKSMKISPDDAERICVSDGGNSDGEGLPVILVDRTSTPCCNAKPSRLSLPIMQSMLVGIFTLCQVSRSCLFQSQKP